MALASAVIVLRGAGEEARRAGYRYLIVHLLGGVLLLAGIAFTVTASQEKRVQEPSSLLLPGEEHFLSNIKQLTFGGSNAEAYFSKDGEWLIFQSTRDGHKCDQLYMMRTDGSDLQKLSSGMGRVTCGYFFDEDTSGPSHFLFSSTEDFGHDCPAEPDHSRGYVWGMFPSYEIYTRAIESDQMVRLTENQAYDAEATVSPDQKSIVFTSDRSGDLELYSMNTDGTNVRQLTHELGYDGGAFFSHDSKKIVYRAFHPQTEREKSNYQTDLANHEFRPSWLEIFVMDADGSNKRQVTDTRMKAANFSPFFFPSDDKIIFVSNANDPSGRKFNLFSVNVDGTDMKQLTHANFDSFPMFSPDGKKLVWASDRNAKGRNARGTKNKREINIFIADWIGD